MGNMAASTAAASLAAAIRHDPKFAGAYVLLARARVSLAAQSVDPDRGFAEAMGLLDRAIRLDPKYVMALTREADLLATCADDKLRDVARARELVREVVKLRPAGPYQEELLGVIAAARGNFDDAIRHQKRALEDRHYSDRRGNEARARLTAYEAKKPYRE